MDIKAFKKLFIETDEAIGDRRFFDTLALIKAIIQDTPDSRLMPQLDGLHESYSLLLMSFDGDGPVGTSNADNLFRQAILLLEQARDDWQIAHSLDYYAAIAKRIRTFNTKDLIDQFHKLHAYSFGSRDYHATLDALFGLLWCLRLDTIVPFDELLRQSDLFARRTLVSALLLGTLEQFSVENIYLLIDLAMSADATPDSSEADAADDDDRFDLQARVAVALTILYRRYLTYFQFFSNEAHYIQQLLQRQPIHGSLKDMLQAFTNQSLVGNVCERINEIMPIVREAMERNGELNGNGNGNVNGNGRSARSDAPGLENGDVNGNGNVNDNANGRSARSDAPGLENGRSARSDAPGLENGDVNGNGNVNDNANGRSARSDAPNLENGNGNVNVNGRSARSDAPGLENGRSARSDAPNLENGDNASEPNFKIQQFQFDEADQGEFFDKLSKHVRHVDEMRDMDLDVNFVSFCNLKHFPFFHHVAHWFYPFSPYELSVKKVLSHPDGSLDRALLLVMANNHFCDSDCYSYVMMTKLLEAKQGDAVAEHLHAALKEAEEAMDEELFSGPIKAVSLNPFVSYCQSLHRFFEDPIFFNNRFHPFSNESYDQLPTLPIFKVLFDHSSDIESSAAMCLELDHEEQAVTLIDSAIELFGASAHLLFMKGEAYMQMESWRSALEAFQQGLIMDDDREVRLRMARCFEALYRWSDALPILQTELQQQLQDFNDEAPDAATVNLIAETGRCLLQLERWEEAIQLFFRLEFMQRHLSVARRSIAWCALRLGRYDRAITAYTQLISKHRATWEDYLNYGHALWLNGHRSDALAAYRKSFAAFNRTKSPAHHHFNHWADAFTVDTHTILSPHFDPATTALMMEAVQAELAN